MSLLLLLLVGALAPAPASAEGPQKTCTEDSCTAVLSDLRKLPPTLGEYLAEYLVQVCYEPFLDKGKKEGWTGEWETEVMETLRRDPTPLNDESDKGVKVIKKVTSLSGDAFKPDCARLEHYFLLSPVYFGLASKHFDYFVVRKAGDSVAMVPVLNEEGAVNYAKADLLARAFKGERGKIDVFAPDLSDADEADLKERILKKLSPAD